jgi:hypothetical protein
MNEYDNAGRTVVTDNWYTSIELAEKLLRRKTHLVGTLRKNRKGIPKSLFEIQIKKADSTVLDIKNKKLQKVQKSDMIAGAIKTALLWFTSKIKKSSLSV